MDYANILIVGCDGVFVNTIKNKLSKYDGDINIFISDFHGYQNHVEESRLDLFIVDCKSNFREALTEINNIKNTRLNSDVPVLIIIDDLVQDEDIVSALAFGVLDFLRIPFTGVELYTRVRAALLLSSSLTKNQRQSKIINDGKERVEEVINEFVPDQVIDEYITGGLETPQRYEEASVLFADLVDFTRKSSKLSPKVLIEELSGIFSAFDNIVRKHHCVRIKTMGDGYMVVSGIPKENTEHAVNLVEAAMEMRSYLQQRNIVNAVKWEVRVGINSGEIIGSTLGQFNLQFDVFGEAVNAASRMEKSCEANQINISYSTYLLVRHQYEFIERLSNDVKGLGVKRMYYLKRKLKARDDYNVDGHHEILGSNFEAIVKLREKNELK